MAKNIALLAIGTEITTGQIIDTNSSFIADHLVNLGYHISCHFSVPDEPTAILEALAFGEKSADILVTTGGLGPTSDDITRDAVALLTDKELTYDDASWGQIKERMAQIGIEAADSNKKQCYFPRGAHIIENRLGTANAFCISKDKKEVICLPGPPHEIKGLFKDFLTSYFKEKASFDDTLILRRWHVLGKSEADLEHIVQSAILGSSFIAGYRPHRPYVEIKIFGYKSKEEENLPYLLKLEELLAPFTISKDDEDAGLLLIEKLAHFDKVHIRDFGSFGVLSDRLSKAYVKSKASMDLRIESFTAFDEPQEEMKDFLEKTPPLHFRGVILPPGQDLSWQVAFSFGGATKERTLNYPFPKRRHKNGQSVYVSEMSLVDCLRLLEETSFA